MNEVEGLEQLTSSLFLSRRYIHKPSFFFFNSGMLRIMFVTSRTPLDAPGSRTLDG